MIKMQYKFTQIFSWFLMGLCSMTVYISMTGLLTVLAVNLHYSVSYLVKLKPN